MHSSSRPQSSLTAVNRPPPVRGGGRPMISARRIARRVRELGQEISEVYADLDQPLVMVVVLKGAAVFAADLLRSLSIPAELEFVRASSYGGGTASSGSVKFAHLVEGPLRGRDILLVEDIVDSGRTITTIVRELERHHPASLRLAALLDRPARREMDVSIHFTGFRIPDRFVIGYGLDYAGLYRELPGIYSLG
ncbi:MAG TPA: hypoxanthine phosphoribosyltransferase [Terriglobales bacterium]|nr:hypoxanthine phosphoribosyltransferase [Candidatus Dormibacteraeota bacterium]HYW24350.1 hypoxanthine phosphoribosyltransferase [Terriglobales bacterium]